MSTAATAWPVNRHGIYRLPHVFTDRDRQDRERAAELQALNEKWDQLIHKQREGTGNRRPRLRRLRAEEVSS